VAEAWPRLSAAERARRLKQLPPDAAHEFFFDLSAADQAEVSLMVPAGERRLWIRLLAPDDVADLIQAAPEDQRAGLLGLLDESTRAEVTALLAYAEDEAGGLMNPRYIRVRPELDRCRDIRHGGRVDAALRAPACRLRPRERIGPVCGHPGGRDRPGHLLHDGESDSARHPSVSIFRTRMGTDDILAGLERGETAALARAISLVENQRDGFERVLSQLHARVGRGATHRIGITGPPGAGKSTLTEGLIQQYRGLGLKVAVVAVDPTSPFTGGALLGDRIRMESGSLDPGVFIRSMATRGAQGGLATTTEEVADVLEAFGFDRILIETVGVGQTELDVAATAETTVLVLVPESGDGIQTLKAGVMEIAEVYVINKSDRPGADKLKQAVEVMLGIRRGNAFAHVPAHHGKAFLPTVQPSDLQWEAPVLMTVASKGEGVDQLVAALDRHHAYLAGSGKLAERRTRRLAARTRAVVNRAVRQWVWDETRAEELLARRLGEVTGGGRSPYDVAEEILDQVRAEAGRGLPQ
jgi:LAO/AO transport system kinase